MEGQKAVAGNIQRAKCEKYAAGNSLPSKAVNQNRRDSFPDREKLKELVTTKPAVQEILRGTVSV